MIKAIDVNIRLSGIKIDEFVILNYKKPSKEINVMTDISFSLGGNEYRQVGCAITVTFKNKSKKDFLKFTSTIAYDIKPEDFKLLQVENTVTLPVDFLRQICQYSVDTVRGILFSKLENTVFNDFILPLKDLRDVITESETFDLDA